MSTVEIGGRTFKVGGWYHSRRNKRAKPRQFLGMLSESSEWILIRWAGRPAERWSRDSFAAWAGDEAQPR